MTAAVDSAFDATGPLLPVASVLFVLWSCVALARQADLRLGAALLVQQVRTVVGVTAAIGVAYLALVAGPRRVPAVVLATTAASGPRPRPACWTGSSAPSCGGGASTRPRGPMRVTVSRGRHPRQGRRDAAGGRRRDRPPADADSQPQRAAEPTA